MVVKYLDSGVRRCGFKSQLCHLLVLCVALGKFLNLFVSPKNGDNNSGCLAVFLRVTGSNPHVHLECFPAHSSFSVSVSLVVIVTHRFLREVFRFHTQGPFPCAPGVCSVTLGGAFIVLYCNFPSACFCPL